MREEMDHSADAQRTDLMTITRFVLNQQSNHPESRGDFSILLSHIVLGCKFLCSAVNKVSIFSLPSHACMHAPKPLFNYKTASFLSIICPHWTRVFILSPLTTVYRIFKFHFLYWNGRKCKIEL